MRNVSFRQFDLGTDARLSVKKLYPSFYKDVLSLFYCNLNFINLLEPKYSKVFFNYSKMYKVV